MWTQMTNCKTSMEQSIWEFRV